MLIFSARILKSMNSSRDNRWHQKFKSRIISRSFVPCMRFWSNHRATKDSKFPAKNSVKNATLFSLQFNFILRIFCIARISVQYFKNFIQIQRYLEKLVQGYHLIYSNLVYSNSSQNMRNLHLALTLTKSRIMILDLLIM